MHTNAKERHITERKNEKIERHQLHQRLIAFEGARARSAVITERHNRFKFSISNINKSVSAKTHIGSLGKRMEKT